MNIDKKYRFIVIDDEPLNNFICKHQIARVFPDANVITFTEPETGLKYITNNLSEPFSGKTILFLDINMPTMSGWEFMAEFEKTSTVSKQQLVIYILSSSVNPEDLANSQANPNIKDFIEKPLTIEVLESL
ncbi:hypothetical protein FLJC2902T_26930 [Flavobacterium limnosediminis JC2902]|uniref:Response regulatory domain-containing protein n=1 Tax=Flavobacterium limnosediminis JC2902 TaxID=1341181 RepID=V6SHQ7_9FLAO|nr:response regulator [Flavobacterium limnosediminis]ESU26213.1 hypothetical protein FLJC2902T_26930 [Flavobacterium limnosediminis JC2902]